MHSHECQVKTSHLNGSAVTLPELIELLAVCAFIALMAAAGHAALKQTDKPLRLLWIAGFFLLASMCIAAGKTDALSALAELIRR